MFAYANASHHVGKHFFYFVSSGLCILFLQCTDIHRIPNVQLLMAAAPGENPSSLLKVTSNTADFLLFHPGTPFVYNPVYPVTHG